MTLLQRIRRFWHGESPPDHPLNEEERDELREASAYDVVAETADRFLGNSFDPDADRRP